MSEKLFDAPHVPIDTELHVLRHPRPDRLIQEFEWEPISDAHEPELTDAQLAERGLFRVIESLAVKAGIAPDTIVDYEDFRRVWELAYPVPRKKNKKKRPR
jgi:hypothetical protein